MPCCHWHRDISYLSVPHPDVANQVPEGGVDNVALLVCDGGDSPLIDHIDSNLLHIVSLRSSTVTKYCLGCVV